MVDVGKSIENNSVEISQVDKMDFSSKGIMGVDPKTPVEDIRASIDEEIDLEEQAWSKVRNRKKSKSKFK